jgi:hypothetical protein
MIWPLTYRNSCRNVLRECISGQATSSSNYVKFNTAGPSVAELIWDPAEIISKHRHRFGCRKSKD